MKSGEPNYNFVEVLLVEDNADDAELTISELRNNNLANNIYHAWNGEEALDFIFGSGKFLNSRKVESVPKLILLDITLPKVNGLEVLERIKAHELTSVIPVVMLTSSNEDPHIKYCYQMGVKSYIVKPVKFDDFASTIRNLGFYWLLLNQQPI